MEVHPPHERIHTAKDFFLHLFTITVGLLIALGLEAGVEALHHRHQLAEARQSIHEELADNQHALEETKAKLLQQQRIFDGMLASVRAARAHTPLPPAEKLFLTGASLKNSSWLTAQNSGALTLMPYAEASHLAEIYEVQGIINTLQTQTISSYGPLLGSLPGAGDMGGVDKLTPTQLDALEDKVQTARGHCRILVGATGELEKHYKGTD